MWGFSPVWVRKCLLSKLGRSNDFPHTKHGSIVFPRCFLFLSGSCRADDEENADICIKLASWKLGKRLLDELVISASRKNWILVQGLLKRGGGILKFSMNKIKNPPPRTWSQSDSRSLMVTGDPGFGLCRTTKANEVFPRHVSINVAFSSDVFSAMAIQVKYSWLPPANFAYRPKLSEKIASFTKWGHLQFWPFQALPQGSATFWYIMKATATDVTNGQLVNDPHFCSIWSNWNRNSSNSGAKVWSPCLLLVFERLRKKGSAQ